MDTSTSVAVGVMVVSGLVLFAFAGILFSGDSHVESDSHQALPDGLEEEISALDANNALERVTSQSWKWRATKSGERRIVRAYNPDRFVLTLNPDGAFSATTDCNSVTGTYEILGSYVSFMNVTTTKKACSAEAQGPAFIETLKNVKEFTLRGDEFLVLSTEERQMWFSDIH